jgi:hypothetical protein
MRAMGVREGSGVAYVSTEPVYGGWRARVESDACTDAIGRMGGSSAHGVVWWLLVVQGEGE